MNKNSLHEYLLLYSIKVFAAFVRALPLKVMLTFGSFLGLMSYYVSPRRASIAYVNLKAAFNGTKTGSELRAIVRSMYRTLGMNMIEALRIPKIDVDYLGHYVRTEGAGHINRALSLKRGGLLVTAHFGNWEMMPIIGSLLGYPVNVVVRAQGGPLLDELLNMNRRHTGVKIIHKGGATRQILHALRHNELVGLLIDQDGGREGVFTDLFKRPASTAKAGLLMAIKSNVPIIPSFMARGKGPYHRLHIYPPLHYDAKAPLEESLRRVVAQFNLLLEAHVELHPDQWLWGHRRWKSTPLKKIAVLSDGKAGHLNQSLAVAHEMRSTHYAGSAYCPVHVVRVAYKSAARKNILKIIGPLVKRSYFLRHTLLQWALAKSSWSDILSSHADIIISAGSTLVPVNCMWAQETGAKNVVIMNPGFPGTRCFTKVISPYHDNLPHSDAITVIDGAPNDVSNRRMTEAIKLLKDQHLLNTDGVEPARFSLGMLLGGNTKKYALTEQMVEVVVNDLIWATKNLEMDLFITTSRRTSREVEDVLINKLSPCERLRLLVIANRKNVAHSVPAILGLSDVLLVSPESISMISEAATAGRCVFVIKEKGAALSVRHERFLKHLTEQGYIQCIEPHMVASTLSAYAENPFKTRRLNDANRIREAVKGLL